MAEKKQQRWKVILNIVTFVALAGLLFLVRDQIIETYHNLERVYIGALILMIPAQVVNFYSYTLLYRDLFTFLGSKLSKSLLWRVTLELNFVNHVFPSGGVSGFSYFSLRLRGSGVSTAKSTLTQLMRFVLTFISFQFLLAVGLFLLAFSGSVNNFVLLIAGSLATLMISGSALMLYIVGSKQRINSFFIFLTKMLNGIISFIHPKHPEAINTSRVQEIFSELHENYMLLKKDPKVLKNPLLYGLLANVTEILTLYLVYIAFGQWVNPGAIILAYAVANFAGLIAVLPGGVGVYEALMTAVLASAGIPIAVSLPVTIMYRILTIVMQLPVGYFYYHKAIQDNVLLAHRNE